MPVPHGLHCERDGRDEATADAPRPSAKYHRQELLSPLRAPLPSPLRLGFSPRLASVLCDLWRCQDASVLQDRTPALPKERPESSVALGVGRPLAGAGGGAEDHLAVLYIEQEAAHHAVQL